MTTRSSHRWQLRTRALLGLWLLASACGDGESPVGPTEPPPPPVDGPPLAVVPAADASRAVHATVTPEAGGVLTATGADGTRYTLSIPAGGVLDSVEVRMTPLASVGNLPLSGGLSGGVQLEPDGLRLAKLATLRIEPAGAVSAADVSGFGYYGSGNGFHLYPARVSGGAATIALFHFSGWGVGQGSAADRQAQSARVPLQWEAELAQQLATTHTTAAAMREAFLAAYRAHVLPRVEKADQTKDLADVRSAVHAALAFDRLVGLSGYDEPLGVEGLPDLLVRYGRVMFQQYRDRCTHAHDLGAVGGMLLVSRQLSLLGASEGLDVGGALAACLRFELDFDSRIVENGSMDEFTEVVSSTVKADDLPITLVLDGNDRLTGSGTLLNLGTAHTGTCHTVFGDLSDGDFRAFRLEVRHGYAPGDTLFGFGRPSQVESVSLLYDPGTPFATMTYTCPFNPPHSVRIARWRGMFQELHRDEWVEQAGLFAVELHPGGTGVLGTRGYNRTLDCSAAGVSRSCKEETVITIYHRPLRS